jgi:arylsulfatase A-like enzyme
VSGGKWHLISSRQETGAGLYDRWPLGRGVERFYGFLGGDTSQWHPDLVYDNHQVDSPATPEEGYHVEKDQSVPLRVAVVNASHPGRTGSQ